MEKSIESLSNEISKMALPRIDIWSGSDFWEKVQKQPALVFLDYDNKFVNNVEIRKINKIIQEGLMSTFYQVYNLKLGF